jgi:uncharacterized LabA/DUF88 family protein
MESTLSVSPHARQMVAIYWDFENIHAALVDEREGERTYTLIRGQRQEKRIDIRAVMEYVATLGDVVINRAYAHWQNFSAYRYDLMEYSVDLIQLYPRGMHGKNGADIRVVLDAMEDVQQFPHVTHVVILSGDSDYIGLAQKLRQAGKTVIGIGVESTTNAFWQKACNQFKYYRTLLVRTKPDYTLTDLPPGRSLADAKTFLAQAVGQLAARQDRELIDAATLRALMTRLDPTFDEGNYGLRSFSAFLAVCGDVVRVEREGEALRVALIEPPPSGPTPDPEAIEAPTAPLPPPATPAGRYIQALRREGIEVPPPGTLRPALTAIADAFATEDGRLGGWWLVDERAATLLAERGTPVDVREVRKARFMAFRARLFKLFGPGAGIGWRTEVDPDLALRAVEQFLLKTVAGFVEEDELDLAVFRSLFHGDGEVGREADLERLAGLARALDERLVVPTPSTGGSSVGVEPAAASSIASAPASSAMSAAPLVPLVPETYDPVGEMMRRRLAQIAADAAAQAAPPAAQPTTEPAADETPARPDAKADDDSAT